jgi:hypothetical protein
MNALTSFILRQAYSDPDDSYSTQSAPPVTALDKATFGVTLSLRAIVILMCLIFLGLCIWKRNRQPLKSRKWIPYVFLISKALSNVAAVQSAWPYGWNNYDLGISAIVACYIQLWGTNPLYIVTMLCVIFMFCRFFVLKAYEKRKIRHQALVHDQHMDYRVVQKSHNISRFIKFLTSPMLLFFVVMVCFFSIYVIGAIDVSRTNGTCSDSWAKYTSNGVPAAVLARYEIFVVLCIAIVGVIIVITDLIVNGHLSTICRCRVSFKEFMKTLFIEDDPLRYRMELYLFAIPAVSLGIMVGAFGLVSTLTTRPAYVVLVRNILYVVFWDIPGLLVIPGMVLFTTFDWERRERRAKQHSSIEYDMGANSPGESVELPEEGVKVTLPKHISDLDITEFNDSADMIHRILGSGDQEAYQLFKGFTSKEFSVENVQVYDDIAAYKNMDSQEDRHKQCKLIFSSYLETNSLSEVNIPRKVIEEVREKVQQSEANPETNPLEKDLFDAILQQVLMNLSDSYLRLWYTQSWKDYIARKKQTKK